MTYTSTPPTARCVSEKRATASQRVRECSASAAAWPVALGAMSERMRSMGEMSGGGKCGSWLAARGRRERMSCVVLGERKSAWRVCTPGIGAIRCRSRASHDDGRW